MSSEAGSTAWDRGRFDARRGPGRILFGRMYEDTAIELAAFRPGGRVLCIASGGCTALALAVRHEVVAVDINPVQLAYAQQRIAGSRGVQGTAERVMAFGRSFAPLVGWWPARVREFLELDEPRAQASYWRRHLDTRRFRMAVDGLFSLSALRAVYAAPFLQGLPACLGAVMRARMARCFERHPNRANPYARALLCGELSLASPPPEARRIRLIHADAAGFLEQQAAGSIDGFALSNILDGADAAYRTRLFAAVARAAAPQAMVVLRSFREPPSMLTSNRAADDRAMLWGIVDVRAAASLN
jgi:S-adenosylmethionine:diacylglycerol 3-amino-3-carboxypropyl transferase